MHLSLSQFHQQNWCNLQSLWAYGRKDTIVCETLGPSINDVTQLWTIFDPLPHRHAFITKAFVLSSQNHCPPPPNTVTLFMDLLDLIVLKFYRTYIDYNFWAMHHILTKKFPKGCCVKNWWKFIMQKCWWSRFLFVTVRVTVIHYSPSFP